MSDGTYRWSAKKEQWKQADPKKNYTVVLLAILALVLLVGVLTCFYTVDDKQQAVVTTFGKVTDITNAGLHFKLPFGIQQVQKVDVNVDFFVEYKISNPVKVLYSSNDPELILRNLIQSQVRNVVGSSTVDSVLTDGKEEIQRQVKELVTQILTEYDIGLTLVDVRIQDSEPPTQEVVEAFKAVETAKQNAEAVVNEAVAYQNAQLPSAEAQANKLLENAEFLKQKRINEAVEQVALFNAMYAEYAQNPQITLSRMYYEAITQVLPDVKVFINTGDGNSVDMLLPLESLMGGQ